jgi:UDP-4-amino-4,6-dideoxy-N-acetyl-beta-L-altrosamine transaminase
MIPYGRQDITREDIDLVIDVLNSEHLTQGPMVPEFESAVSTHVGSKHAVAVNSATSALHIACLALGLADGDWLWTSPITFVASANCGLYCNAKIDFVDIDPKTYNLCVYALERKLIIAERSGCVPKVLVVVHMCGQSCDMMAVHSLSRKYGFRVIEDASHAIGGKYRQKHIGCGQFSDVTVFSFHPVKVITTAEGGMVLTNDSVVAEKLQLLRSHGVTRDPQLMTIPSEGPWFYEQIALGFNYRMNELQAALGCSQLTRLDEYVTRRHVLSNNYNTLLSELPLLTPWQHPDSYSSYHLYAVRLQLDKIKMTRAEVFQYLRSQNIGVNVHYIPVHLQPYYQRLGFKLGDFPEAEKYYNEALTLPLFPKLQESQQLHIKKVLEKVLD